MKKEKAKTNKSKVSVELNIKCTIEADNLLEAVEALKSRYNVDVEAEGVAARIECTTDNDVAGDKAHTRLSNGDMLKVSVAPMKCVDFAQHDEADDEAEPEPDAQDPQAAQAEAIAKRIEEILGQIEGLKEKWGGKRHVAGKDSCVECGRGCNRPFGGQGYTTIIGGTGPDMLDMLRYLRDSGELF